MWCRRGPERETDFQPQCCRKRAVSDELCADREVVLAAVKQSGYALESASEELRADREVVMAAVKQDGRALRCASNALQADPRLLSWSKLTRVQSRWRRLREHVRVFDPIGTYWLVSAVYESIIHP